MLVKRIAYDGGEEALVVKLYSNLALLRTEQRQRGLSGQETERFEHGFTAGYEHR